MNKMESRYIMIRRSGATALLQRDALLWETSIVSHQKKIGQHHCYVETHCFSDFLLHCTERENFSVGKANQSLSNMITCETVPCIPETKGRIARQEW